MLITQLSEVPTIFEYTADLVCWCWFGKIGLLRNYVSETWIVLNHRTSAIWLIWTRKHSQTYLYNNEWYFKIKPIVNLSSIMRPTCWKLIPPNLNCIFWLFKGFRRGWTWKIVKRYITSRSYWQGLIQPLLIRVVHVSILLLFLPFISIFYKSILINVDNMLTVSTFCLKSTLGGTKM